MTVRELINRLKMMPDFDLEVKVDLTEADGYEVEDTGILEITDVEYGEASHKAFIIAG